MAEATATVPTPHRPRRWLKVIGIVVGVLVVLVIAAYFVGTSSAFFKGVILPKASKALNATVTVSDAELSPFKQVLLHNLKVETTGTEPLVTAPEVVLRYSLGDILRGNIHVYEVTLVSPTVVVVQNPDGTSNLDPILKAQEQKPTSAQPQPSKPPHVKLEKFAVKDATLRQVKLYKGGNRDVAELTHFNLAVDNVQNGQTGKMNLSSDIGVNNNPPAPGAGSALQAKLDGQFTFGLTADLKPSQLQGAANLKVVKAEGAMTQLAALGATLNCNATPTEIKEIALRMQQGDTGLGEVLASGPFNLEKAEGRISLAVVKVDKHLLNFVGASSGLDFGPTTINSTNEIQAAKAGKVLTVTGALNLNQFQVTRTNQSTPPLDLKAVYDTTVSLDQTNALIRTLTVTGTQKGSQFLKGELTSPMFIALGGGTGGTGDSALNVAVTHFDLANWKPFLGEVAPAGDVNANLQLLSQNSGKQLKFELKSAINNLTALAGTNQLTQLTVSLQARGQTPDMNLIDLPEYRLEVARANQPMVNMNGSGKYDLTNQTADIQLNGQILFTGLAQALQKQDLSIASGTAELKTRILQKQKNQDITGNFALVDLTGKCGENAFTNYGASADLDIGMTPERVQIRKVSGKLSQGKNAGGAFTLTGTYGLTNQAAQLNANVVDLNQNGLRPLLEPALGDKKLVSIAMNANASVQYIPAGASALKADLQVTNLVVNDPKGQVPAKALAATMAVDASLNKDLAEVRQLQLGLSPTDRATNNKVQFSGWVNMTNSKAIQGSLKLAANTLDLTTYYDLFSGGSKSAATQTAANTGAPAQPTAASSTPEKEPEATTMPFTNFTCEASVKRLYLHEVDISDFQTTVKINGSRLSLNPCKLALNGAPVGSTVELDLGVPGYKYELGFNAQAVPLAPLVNSFQPESKGKVGGTFSAQTQLSGTGTTGASLKKTLKGQFQMGSTNLNLSVVDIKNPVLKAVINVVAMIPELIKNPDVGTLLTGLTGKGASSGTLTDELSKSPIDSIVARGAAGSGRVTLEQATVQSLAFRADAAGTVTLANVLTNSELEIPVTVALSQSVAQRVNLAGPNTTTNAAYVNLPSFLTMKGTVGKPDPVINKMALAGLALKGIGGAIPNIGGGKAGNIIQGLGGVLGGNAAQGNTAASGTNQPKSGGGLLQGLGGLLGGSTTSSTNAPPSQSGTNQSPLGNMLNQILKPKQ